MYIDECWNERIREWGRPYREEGWRKVLSKESSLARPGFKAPAHQTLWPDARMGCGQKLMKRRPISQKYGPSRFWMPSQSRRCLPEFTIGLARTCRAIGPSLNQQPIPNPHQPEKQQRRNKVWAKYHRQRYQMAGELVGGLFQFRSVRQYPHSAPTSAAVYRPNVRRLAGDWRRRWNRNFRLRLSVVPSERS